MALKHGKIIKKLRLEKGLTQKELADTLHKAESTIGMWEQGRRELDYDSLKELADLFDVSVDYLLGRVEIKDEKKVIVRLKLMTFNLLFMEKSKI